MTLLPDFCNGDDVQRSSPHIVSPTGNGAGGVALASPSFTTVTVAFSICGDAVEPAVQQRRLRLFGLRPDERGTPALTTLTCAHGDLSDAVVARRVKPSTGGNTGAAICTRSTVVVDACMSLFFPDESPPLQHTLQEGTLWGRRRDSDLCPSSGPNHSPCCDQYSWTRFTSVSISASGYGVALMRARIASFTFFVRVGMVG